MYSKWLIDISHSCSKQSNIQTEAMYISWSICVFVSSFEKIHLFTFLKSIFPISLRQIWKSNQKLQALLRWKALCWGETLWVHPRSGDWWLDYSLYWNQGSRVHCQDDDKPNLWAHRIHNLKQRASIQTAHGSPERDTWWERGDRPGWGVREKGKLFSTTLSWGGAVLGRAPLCLKVSRSHSAFRRKCSFLNVWDVGMSFAYLTCLIKICQVYFCFWLCSFKKKVHRQL